MKNLGSYERRVVPVVLQKWMQAGSLLGCAEGIFGHQSITDAGKGGEVNSTMGWLQISHALLMPEFSNLAIRVLVVVRTCQACAGSID